MLSKTLSERGFVHNTSAPLELITDGPKRTVYLGVDPTADSIHVGNLTAYMLLRHFADAGHKVVMLVGGGTALAGDPKPDVERSLSDPATVKERAEKLGAQAKKLLGDVEVTFVNNADWLTTLNLIDFLRDTGKHFTVNNLIKKDAIAERLKREDGLSVTEFSYPLLQGYDFWHMFTTMGVDTQIGGSDQWGNIIAGVDLIHKKEGKDAYALTLPLVTDDQGRKFGKSEGNAIWLDPEKTSPSQFYQFWINLPDSGMEKYFKLFTLLSLEKIQDIIAEHDTDRGQRIAQKRLAFEVTKMIHGESYAEKARDSATSLFSKKFTDLSQDEIYDAVNGQTVFQFSSGTSIIDALVTTGLATSRRESRQFIEGGAVAINGEKTVDLETLISREQVHLGYIELSRGKKSKAILQIA